MFTYAALTFSSVAFIVQYNAREWAAADGRAWFRELESSPVPHIETYDFIVVGGGTAGCVVAARLSEDGTHSVLLLEAGGNPPPQLQIPGYRTLFEAVPEVVFQYHGVPQDRYGRAFNGGAIPLRAGKVLGGTSSINAMLFNRGNPRDYDEWARATGDASWRYENLLKYFKKLENYSGEFPHSEHHGTDGGVTVSKQKYAPGLQTWIDAGRELGYASLDPNGPQQESIGVIEYSRRRGWRIDSYTAYLKNVEGVRKNLKISRYSTAHEIVLDSKKRAVGVAYKRHGVLQFAKASKEIVISAGAFGSPKLLLKSGIGPEEELRAIPEITPKHELPVGRSLLDHPQIPLQIFVNDSSLHFDPLLNITEDTHREFYEFGTGPLSSDMSLTGQGFIVTTVAEQAGEADWPDMQLSLYGQDHAWLPLPKTASKPGEGVIYMFPYLGREKSSGTLKLNPEDVDGVPLIDFNYFAHNIDMLTYLAAINQTLELFEGTEAYQRVGARYPTEPLPQCEDHPFRSNAYWECFVRCMTFSGLHAAGTCKMGKQGDPSAVVDSKLRVVGISGLRVADASIMPSIVNANTQAACYVIGEKAAAVILEQWHGGQRASASMREL